MAWGVWDYPEPPAYTTEELYMMRHGCYYDEEEDYGDAEEEADD